MRRVQHQVNPQDPGPSTFATQLLATIIGALVVIILLRQPNLTQSETSQLLADIAEMLGLLAATRQLPPSKPTA